MPPRLIRRQPFLQRVKAAVNPMDWLLWLSEEIETRDWSNSKSVGTWMGLVMNFSFMVARACNANDDKVDDVFGDGDDLGCLGYFLSTLVWVLMGLGCLNAVYTINRSRKYRLFEADVEKDQGTPSAQRVQVQSSPVSSSPLRVFSDWVGSESAESRSHPDRTRDVWEISVWDPLPMTLRIFSVFSPGHVLIYLMFLPLAQFDERPSVTVFKCLVLQGIMSAQIILLQMRFSQQNKDTSIIQKEVMNEYDTKFVHPRLYPTMRDASTQISQDDDGNDQEIIEVGTPMTQLRRGFRANPNPNYVKHFDPDGNLPVRPCSSHGLFTPPVARQVDVMSSVSTLQTRPSALRRSTPGPSTFNMSISTTQKQTQTPGAGGYLGVFAHPSSPLKKNPSMADLQFRSPRNNAEMAKLEQYNSYKAREQSPMKSTRKSTGTATALNPQQPSQWNRNRHSYERYPSLWQ